MPSARQVAFGALAVAAVGIAGWSLVGQWRDFRASGAVLHLSWTPLALSAGLVLVSYAVLIETWRRTVRAWGSNLRWSAAARIWFVSNLGRYLPGKVWQIGAMGALAQREGVSPVAATGSALVVNLVNLLAGLGVVLVTGTRVLTDTRASVILAVLLLLSTVAAPRVIRTGAGLASRVFGRRLDVPSLPPTALLVAIVGCTAAWVLYGVAFRYLAAAVLGSTSGTLAGWIAAFTGSYLAGYIAVFAPGGIGVREVSLVSALGRLGLVGAAGAGGPGVVAVASRLWLTVLEVIPGVLLLAVSSLHRRRPTNAAS